MLAGLWPSSEVWGLQPHWVGLGNGSVVPALKPLWIFCWAAMDEWIPFHFITRLPCNRSLLYLKYPLLLLFSCSAISDSLRPHGLQHARLPCPSASPRVCTNSCLLSWWCHPTISSSVDPFFSCLQSFPASGSFLTSCLFASGGQSIGASTSASVLPMNIQDWFPLGLTGLISLQPKELSRVFSNTPIQKYPFFRDQFSLWSNSHIHLWLLEKSQLWLCGPLLVNVSAF